MLLKQVRVKKKKSDFFKAVCLDLVSKGFGSWDFHGLLLSCQGKTELVLPPYADFHVNHGRIHHIS